MWRQEAQLISLLTNDMESDRKRIHSHISPALEIELLFKQDETEFFL